MNHYVKIALVVCACIALTSAQYGNYDFDFSDFGSSYSGPVYSGASPAAQRDPRANTGPVLFPVAPSSGPSQTSGVIVGASGFGFVRPNSQGPAIPRFFYRRRLYLRR